MVELVGGGSDIKGATLSSFSVSVLLLSSVERFGVSSMQDFFFIIFSILNVTFRKILSISLLIQRLPGEIFLKVKISFFIGC